MTFMLRFHVSASHFNFFHTFQVFTGVLLVQECAVVEENFAGGFPLFQDESSGRDPETE